MSWGSKKARRGASRRSSTVEKKPVEKKPLPPIKSRPSRNPVRETAGLGRYLHDHLLAIRQSLLQFRYRWLSNLLTSLVLGLALALPAVLYVFLNNVQILTHDWQGEAQVSLFLGSEVDEDRAWQLAEEFRGHTLVSGVQYISKGEAFESFRQFEGFSEVLDAFDDNPLPEVLVVSLIDGVDQASVKTLVAEWQQRAEIETAQLDLEWLQRLQAMVEIASRALVGLVILLGMAVLLVVANTIRLVVQEKRDEIEVGMLIGATDGFIRRPFLYGGAWYGLLGAALAWLIVMIMVGLLSGPVEELTALYGNAFPLSGLAISEVGLLLVAGAGLGLLASWLTVDRHLSHVSP